MALDPRAKVSVSSVDHRFVPVVVVTGANGLVGSRICAVLAERGASVRAVVRRSGTGPALPGVEEWVGEFLDPEFAARVVAGADAVVTTVHPMGSDRQVQQRDRGRGHAGAGARCCAMPASTRLVHISTAAVYDRSPDGG